MKRIEKTTFIAAVAATTILAFAVGCGSESPAAAPTEVAASPVPSPVVASTPPPTASPVPEDEFEASLAAADKQKFQSLPSEFQDALRQANDAEGAAAAVQYLRGLPDDTLPIAEVLEPHALGWFDALQPQDQHYMLLEAYPAAYDHAGPEWIDFAFEFERMVGVAFDNRGVRLPPVEEALSADALAKLDALENPIMSRVFHLVWNGSKPLPEDVDDTIARLQANLLAAPADLPSLEELGLSAEASRQFSELPTDMQDWLWKTVANYILSFGRQEWPYWPVEDEYIRTLSTPAAKEAFDRGIWPRGVYLHGPSTFACLDRPSHWPDAVAARMPEGIEDLPVVYLPPYQDVLSPDALGRLDTLDANLKAVFENMWNWTNPVAPVNVLCDITKLERGIMDIPVTSAPAAEDLLSDDGLALYRQLSDSSREWIDEGIAQALLGGLVVIRGEEGSLSAHVWSFDTPPEDFIAAVGVYVEESIEIMFAAGPGPSSRAADPPAQQEGTDDLPPAIQILAPEYQEAYRLLPDGEWARKFHAWQFDYPQPSEWAAMDDTPPASPESPPELGAAAEFRLTQVLRDEDMQGWLLGKIQELDVGSAQEFEAANTEAERLGVFKRMVENELITPRMLEIEIVSEWQYRLFGHLTEEEIERTLDMERLHIETTVALGRLSWKERIARTVENRVCEFLMWDVVGEHDLGLVITDGECDVDAVVRHAQRALEAGGGHPIPTEEEYRERVESHERFLQGEFDPPQDPPTLDS